MLVQTDTKINPILFNPFLKVIMQDEEKKVISIHLNENRFSAKFSLKDDVMVMV